MARRSYSPSRAAAAFASPTRKGGVTHPIKTGEPRRGDIVQPTARVVGTRTNTPGVPQGRHSHHKPVSSRAKTRRRYSRGEKSNSRLSRGTLLLGLAVAVVFGSPPSHPNAQSPARKGITVLPYKRSDDFNRSQIIEKARWNK